MVPGLVQARAGPHERIEKFHGDHVPRWDVTRPMVTGPAKRGLDFWMFNIIWLLIIVFMYVYVMLYIMLWISIAMRIYHIFIIVEWLIYGVYDIVDNLCAQRMLLYTY